MGDNAIYVEIDIKADVDRVWQLTQDPAQHPRWDLRFSSITPVAELPTGGNRFLYQRRALLHTITGTGTSLGERQRPDGTHDGKVLDYLGTHQHLAVDLDLSVERDGSLRLRSDAQRFYEGPLAFRFPMLSSGRADLRVLR